MTIDTAERKAYLRKEMKEYLSTRNATPEEKRELRAWVNKGNSVYDNPWYIYGENGCPMDYLAAAEADEERCEQMKAGEIVWPELKDCDPILDAPLS